jgi:hypothetical protein
VDPDPAYHFDADPDTAYDFDADPDPTFQFDAMGGRYHTKVGQRRAKF